MVFLRHFKPSRLESKLFARLKKLVQNISLSKINKIPCKNFIKFLLKILDPTFLTNRTQSSFYMVGRGEGVHPPGIPTSIYDMKLKLDENNELISLVM